MVGEKILCCHEGYHQIFNLWSRFSELCGQLLYQIKLFFGLTPINMSLAGVEITGASFTVGAEVVAEFLHNHDLDLMTCFLKHMNYLFLGFSI